MDSLARGRLTKSTLSAAAADVWPISVFHSRERKKSKRKKKRNGRKVLEGDGRKKMEGKR